MSKSATVTHINSAKEQVLSYKGHTIHINHRPEVNDFEYSFTHTRTLKFSGHASHYDACVGKATKNVDALITKPTK